MVELSYHGKGQAGRECLSRALTQQFGRVTLGHLLEARRMLAVRCSLPRPSVRRKSWSTSNSHCLTNLIVGVSASKQELHRFSRPLLKVDYLLWQTSGKKYQRAICQPHKSS